MVKASYDREFMQTEEYLFLPERYLRIKGLHALCYAKFDHAGDAIVEHYHPGCMELTVMLGGSQKYAVKDRVYTIRSGEVLTNFVDEVHSTGAEPQGVSEYICFELDLREKEDFLCLSKPWASAFYERWKTWDKRLVRLPNADLELLKCAFGAFSRLVQNQEDQESRMEGHGLLLAFLNRVLKAEEVRQQEDQIVEQARRYLDAHIQERLSVADIAKALGVTQNRLRDRFLAELGMLPKEYLNRAKIECAKALLRQEQDLSITALAYRLGYSDSSHFSVLFRQYAGCSPSEYRRNARRNK